MRDLRQADGLTLAALADRASMSTSYLNDLEHDRTLPSLPRLQAIASALGMSVIALLEGVHGFDD
jgi:transcriptional regulator with XRE-family HTH domain